jgi:ribonuclease P/MRP protein subunit POP5
MVRIKHRYLLVNILYPESDGKPFNPTLPSVIQFHQPTTDKVLDRDLIKGIKEEVDFMFGDYGAGAISDSSSM